ncbi:hypothetical protein BV22DRAFT_1030864 [Leucogyrophana mollusca]|uniref:Uncharacterized protein n=1 Tax=Leucogyrophana mollusca TaxID=85980 RepID=A0ACB8BSH8_9AGAM|nr:hypothetical protein BV22DRAFT_1030864 [Leucogyrophana mollusca]
MDNISSAVKYGPGFMGLIISLWLYGITFGQYVFYLCTFPLDKKALKFLVLIVFLLDSGHSYSLSAYYWLQLISWRASPASALFVPWELMMGMVFAYCVALIVQSFYAHRVWIISGHNKFLAGAVFVMAIAQFALGMTCVADTIRERTAVSLANSVLTVGSASAISIICDLIITGSIFFYLHPRRAGVKRLGSPIPDLVNVSVNMGAFTCLVSLVVFLMYFIHQDPYLVGAATPIMCKSYSNSFLAVLNARKLIRDRQEARVFSTFNLTTIDISHPPSATVASSHNQQA